MQIRLLTPDDALIFHGLRLEGLRQEPSAFGSSYEEEKDFSVARIEERFVPRKGHGIFGAFEDNKLVGNIGLARERMKKLSHKATIWGLYVRPEARSQGVARALLIAALELARSAGDLRRITLGVNARNTPAIRLYEACGFKAFGLEPDALCIDGELHDEIHMSLLLADTQRNPA